MGPKDGRDLQPGGGWGCCDGAWGCECGCGCWTWGQGSGASGWTWSATRWGLGVRVRMRVLDLGQVKWMGVTLGVLGKGLGAFVRGQGQ